MFRVSRDAICIRVLIAATLAAVALPATADDETIIEVVVDVPCAILINDVVAGRADPYVASKFVVESGYVDITALSLQVPEIEWSDSIRISDGDTEAVEVELNDEVEDLVEEQDMTYLRESRLENQDDGTVKDPETGLYWTVLDNNFDIDWNSSTTWCSTLMLSREKDESPWRLPTLDELRQVEDQDFWDGFKILGQIRVSGCCVWSSEEHGNVSAWYFDFENGERGFVTREYSEGGRVLCVR